MAPIDPATLAPTDENAQLRAQVADLTARLAQAPAADTDAGAAVSSSAPAVSSTAPASSVPGVGELVRQSLAIGGQEETVDRYGVVIVHPDDIHALVAWFAEVSTVTGDLVEIFKVG